MMTPHEYNRCLPKPGNYAREWRRLNAMPADESVRVPGWIAGMPGWNVVTLPAARVCAAMLAALDARINARAGLAPREPREGFGAHARDAYLSREINTCRIRVYCFETRQARRRLSHLLSDPND